MKRKTPNNNNNKTNVIQRGWHFTSSSADKPMALWVSPQRSRVEIFYSIYFNFRPEMLGDGKQKLLEHHHHHVIFRSHETLEISPFLLVHHSMFNHSGPCFIICPAKLHTVYSTPAYKTPVTHFKCLGTSEKSSLVPRRSLLIRCRFQDWPRREHLGTRLRQVDNGHNKRKNNSATTTLLLTYPQKLINK